MAHSRLEKIGTIYSRITGLIRSGAMKLEDRPLWYEVYQAFPPREDPMYGKQSQFDTRIRKLFYPEDAIRAKFHKQVSNIPAVNLSDNKNETLCQNCIHLTLKISKDKGIDLDTAFDEAFKQLKVQVDTPRKSDPKTSKDPLNVQNILKET